MLKRYAGAAGAGILVTAALILWMQTMIRGGEIGPEPGHSVRLAMPVIPPPDVAIDEPTPPPEPPEPVAELPDTPTLVEPRPDLKTTFTGTPMPRPPRWTPGDRTTIGPPGNRFGHGSGDGGLLPAMRFTPLYPRAAELRELEGHVTVEFTVTPKGTVTDVRIVESTHPVFDRAAVEAAAKFRYTPRVVDGTAVAVAGVRTRFDFRLDD